MVTTELGACEWFVWDLRRSNLIERNQLDDHVASFMQKQPRGEPAELAQYLVAQGALTDFQAERLLQGKTQGFVLGPFTLQDALGAGSMGTVYKAQSKNDNQFYAVKVLPRRSMWNVRIARRKVRCFEQARHPSVVPFVDVGTAGGMHYLAWPFVEGELLDKIVADQGKLKPSLAAYYALQVAEGLDTCHQQGLIHGLLKPSNLLVNTEHQVKILDFGIGCLLAETEGESLVDTMSTCNAVTSGLDCASPESIMDPTNLTPAGDQYSLGCTLYFMVTGQVPFPNGSAAEKMMAHQFKQPTPVSQLNPDVPADLIAVIDRLMQKSPDARYTSTAELIEALRQLAATPTVLRAATRPAPQPAKAPAAPDGLRTPASGGSQPGFKAATGTTGVTAPTPRPASMGTLPTRASMRGTGSPAPAPKPEPAPQPEEAAAAATSEVPGYFADEDDLSLEDRLGPMGVILSALAACALVYFAAVWLHLL